MVARLPVGVVTATSCNPSSPAPALQTQVYIYETHSGAPKKVVPLPQNRHNLTYPVSEVTPSPLSKQAAVHATTGRTLTPTKDALVSSEEWMSLLESLKWPSPNKIVSSPNEATDPTKCSYDVIGLQKSYTLGDFLHVLVVARDTSGRLKTHGGDFFQAKLHNSQLKASTFGLVKDHLNGTYTVRFSLLWPGATHVSVRLVHSSEAVQVLSRQREQDPDKVVFYGYFVDGGRTEQVVCNAQQSPWLFGDGTSCCCRYRDPVTGESWFCRRPNSLPCSTLTDHSMGRYQAKLSSLDASILHKDKTNINVPGRDPEILVLPHDINTQTPACQPGLDTPVPAGFYFQDHWTSLVCRSRAFNTASLVSACLKDKQVHMMGDSTLRQWFEYLESAVPALKRLNLHTSALSGPLEAVDPESNMILNWRAHGLPLRTSRTPIADLHYIGREIDGLAGGQHTIIVFNIWAHFTTYPVGAYMHRLATIRKAITSLLQRAPSTLVVIKSANTGYKDVYGSDWLSWQLDLTLRAMFKGLPVVFIDVWQMTSCHYSPDNIHPAKEVIRNEVDLFLSFVCPQ
ncbi:hypothetical protein AAFF_G00121230 [Aldrovandia affinis]|uniref:NXPE C-terminal domain-containing protein n=1 Tax=Aldrovandia affinis TaxID=143900 RepID=A0AAD7RRV4_9TELE|nr:hypothetical protein AAFF_G00121230 [Aldrovandia affinis]